MAESILKHPNAGCRVDERDHVVTSLLVDHERLVTLDKVSDPMFPFHVFDTRLTVSHASALASFLTRAIKQDLIDNGMALFAFELMMESFDRLAVHGSVPF